MTFRARLRAPGLPIRQRNLEKENREREQRRRTRAARCKGGSVKWEREGRSGRNGRASEETEQRDTGACHSHQSAAVCVRRRGARWTRTAAVDLSTSTIAAVTKRGSRHTQRQRQRRGGEKAAARTLTNGSIGVGVGSALLFFPRLLFPQRPFPPLGAELPPSEGRVRERVSGTDGAAMVSISIASPCCSLARECRTGDIEGRTSGSTRFTR